MTSLGHIRKAIILKNYSPYHQQGTVFRLSIFDEHSGRLDLYCRKRVFIGNPCNGALIIHDGTKSSHPSMHYFVTNFAELISVPSLSVMADLYFFHQVLEVTHYFAPNQQSMPEVFLFLCCLYETFGLSALQKKLALCRLLYLVGVCPDGAPYHMPILFSLISSSWDIMLNENIHGRVVEDVDAWLADCMNTHPSAHKLKTLTFS